MGSNNFGTTVYKGILCCFPPTSPGKMEQDENHVLKWKKMTVQIKCFYWTKVLKFGKNKSYVCRTAVPFDLVAAAAASIAAEAAPSLPARIASSAPRVRARKRDSV